MVLVVKVMECQVTTCQKEGGTSLDGLSGSTITVHGTGDAGKRVEVK